MCFCNDKDFFLPVGALSALVLEGNYKTVTEMQNEYVSVNKFCVWQKGMKDETAELTITDYVKHRVPNKCQANQNYKKISDSVATNFPGSVKSLKQILRSGHFFVSDGNERRAKATNSPDFGEPQNLKVPAGAAVFLSDPTTANPKHESKRIETNRANSNRGIRPAAKFSLRRKR
ncbi:hypothetical protein E5288_WYG004964 [Bos mutus]|uniref:Uncharacterized protein n=1 Tax=Bos mutus TaxID=72004 RepID=A0A6B0R234_9CETA|nr:hypothetical protein [Bos mutus]